MKLSLLHPACSRRKYFRHRSTTARKRTIFHDEDTPNENVNEMNETDVFDVIGGLTVHFSAAKQISHTFSFLLKYQKMSKEELKCKAAKLAEETVCRK